MFQGIYRNPEIKAVWLLSVKLSLTSVVRMLIPKLRKRRETIFFYFRNRTYEFTYVKGLEGFLKL